MPRECPVELHDRAVRMVLERHRDCTSITVTCAAMGPNCGSRTTGCAAGSSKPQLMRVTRPASGADPILGGPLLLTDGNDLGLARGAAGTLAAKRGGMPAATLFSGERAMGLSLSDHIAGIS